MCQKDGRNGWVPGSFLVSKSAVVSVNLDDVLGFAGNTAAGLQSSKSDSTCLHHTVPLLKWNSSLQYSYMQ